MRIKHNIEEQKKGIDKSQNPKEFLCKKPLTHTHTRHLKQNKRNTPQSKTDVYFCERSNKCVFVVHLRLTKCK